MAQPNAAPRGMSPAEVGTLVSAIEWGATCGQRPSALPLEMAVEWVTTAEACGALEAAEWDDVLLEAQNQLTEWLHSNARAAYASWNQRVVRIKQELLAPLEGRLSELPGKLMLPEVVVDSIRWSILGAAMESEYVREGHQVVFFLQLLSVYEAGRIPCGWRGSWPEGALLVL